MDYINNQYDKKTPIFLAEIYNKFPNVSTGVIRSILKRYHEQGILVRISKGVYALPNKESILGKPTVYVKDVFIRRYIRDANGKRFGYKSGFYVSNMLRLTSQTASVITYYSNRVAKKRRKVTINNHRAIVNRSRVFVTDRNYKLLQVMDLLIHFEKYSEYPIIEANDKITTYLKNTDLTSEEIDDIISAYPKNAQLLFYKMNGFGTLKS